MGNDDDFRPVEQNEECYEGECRQSVANDSASVGDTLMRTAEPLQRFLVPSMDRIGRIGSHHSYLGQTGVQVKCDAAPEARLGSQDLNIGWNGRWTRLGMDASPWLHSCFIDRLRQTYYWTSCSRVLRRF